MNNLNNIPDENQLKQMSIEDLNNLLENVKPSVEVCGRAPRRFSFLLNYLEQSIENIDENDIHLVDVLNSNIDMIEDIMKKCYSLEK